MEKTRVAFAWGTGAVRFAPCGRRRYGLSALGDNAAPAASAALEAFAPHGVDLPRAGGHISACLLAAMGDVQHINVPKKLLSAAIYGVTIMAFIIAGAASQPPMLVTSVTPSPGGG